MDILLTDSYNADLDAYKVDLAITKCIILPHCNAGGLFCKGQLMKYMLYLADTAGSSLIM